MQRTSAIQLAVALTGAAVLAQGALAGGERKNDPPFTRHVAATGASNARVDVRGERKNQRPFTRRIRP